MSRPYNQVLSLSAPSTYFTRVDRQGWLIAPRIYRSEDHQECDRSSRSGVIHLTTKIVDANVTFRAANHGTGEDDRTAERAENEYLATAQAVNIPCSCQSSGNACDGRYETITAMRPRKRLTSSQAETGHWSRRLRCVSSMRKECSETVYLACTKLEAEASGEQMQNVPASLTKGELQSGCKVSLILATGLLTVHFRLAEAMLVSVIRFSRGITNLSKDAHHQCPIVAKSVPPTRPMELRPTQHESISSCSVSDKPPISPSLRLGVQRSLHLEHLHLYHRGEEAIPMILFEHSLSALRIAMGVQPATPELQLIRGFKVGLGPTNGVTLEERRSS